MAFHLRDGWFFRRNDADGSAMSNVIRDPEPGDPEYQNVDLWVRELTTAGWSRYRGMQTVWRAPNGSLYRGPFGAWKTMKAGAQ